MTLSVARISPLEFEVVLSVSSSQGSLIGLDVQNLSVLGAEIASVSVTSNVDWTSEANSSDSTRINFSGINFDGFPEGQSVELTFAVELTEPVLPVFFYAGSVLLNDSIYLQAELTGFISEATQSNAAILDTSFLGWQPDIITGDDANLFSIQSSSSELVLNTASSNEEDPSYSFVLNSSDEETVLVSIENKDGNDPPNTLPVTLADILEDANGATITQSQLLANATDPENTTLTASNLSISEGSGTLNDNQDGSWNFVPSANDDTSVVFTYLITDEGTSDGFFGPQSITGSASLDIVSVNDAPILASSQTLTTAEETSLTVSVNATDVEGDTLSYALQSAPSFGIAIETDNGIFNYAPNQDFVGADSFIISVSDGNGGTSVQTVNLTVTAVEDEATGSLNVSGLVSESNSLSAELANLEDVDGTIVSIAYQWQLSPDGNTGWQSISGATSSNFTINSDQSQVGKYLRVVATSTDALGGETEFASNVGAIANVNDAPIGFSASISGTAAENETLTASASVTSDDDGLDDPVSFSYQWQRSADGSNWSDIAGATSAEFSPNDAEVGSYLRVVASYTDNQGTVETVASSATTSTITNVNDAPIGFSASISGTAAENETLTASASVTSDDDGLDDPVSFSYQWQRSADGSNWSDIAGATSAEFIPNDAEVGSYLRVVASYTDNQGTVETVASSATTSTITNVNDAPIGFSASISGTAAENETLTASASVTSDDDGLDDPVSFSYQWQRSADGSNWSDIAGATSAGYTLGDDDASNQVRVSVSYTDSQGTEETVSSNAQTVTNVNDAPIGFSASISGTAAENETLTASASVTSDDDGLDDPVSFSYQWQRSADGSNWSDIAGATSAEFIPNDAEVGSYLRVVASYTDNQGTVETVASSATTSTITNVNDAPIGFSASISGTAAENETLTASASVTSDDDGLDDPVSFSYQWQRSADGSNWSDIAGATSAGYTLGDDDASNQVRVSVSYTDSQGTEETVSSNAQTVTNVNDAPIGFSASISGTAAENETLTASASVTLDDDGLDDPVSFSYQWQRSADGSNWSDIAGATSAEFSPNDAEVGSYLRVVASYTDNQGTVETVASSATTSTITNVNDAPIGFSASISGTAAENETLTASASVTSDDDGLDDPVSFSYQWQRSADGSNWSDIAGATSAEFSPNDAEVGSYLRVVASYTDNQGTVETVASSATTSTITNVNDAPIGFSASISGTAAENETLTASASVTSDDDGLDDPVSFSYQWQRSADGSNWSDIAGATSAEFIPNDAEVGSYLRVVASYTDNQGTVETVASSATTSTITNVNDAPIGFSASISGTAAENETLTASASVTSDDDGLDDPVSFSYQWQRSADGSNWSDIAGATSAEFSPNDAEVGSYLRVVASYTDNQGTVETVASSATTSTITNVNDAPIGQPTILGLSREDETLSVDISAISDDDGLPSDISAYSFQWQVSTDTGDWFYLFEGDSQSELVVHESLIGAQIRVVVSYIDEQGFSERIFSEATLPVEKATFPISGSILDRNESAISDVEVSLNGDNADLQMTSTNEQGFFELISEPLINATILVDKNIDAASEKAIGSFDALQALRLAVGLTKSDGTADWQDYIASDFNQDGRVNSADALNILKYAVGLTGGPTADWIFLDSDGDYSNVRASNTQVDANTFALGTIDYDQSINMIGILVGDVDGSFIA